MELFLSFFEHLPVVYKALWIIFCIALFWVLEGYFGLFNLRYRKWRHAKTNFIFLFFVMLINMVFGVIAAFVFIWSDHIQFGLLHYISAPVWAELLISIIVLDLIAQYFVHYLLHRVKWMWRLHIVHHSDRNVDVTSGTI